MLFWLERRSTQTAVSMPAAVPAMRGLRCTGFWVVSSLTLVFASHEPPAGRFEE